MTRVDDFLGMIYSHPVAVVHDSVVYEPIPWGWLQDRVKEASEGIQHWMNNISPEHVSSFRTMRLRSRTDSAVSRWLDHQATVYKQAFPNGQLPDNFPKGNDIMSQVPQQLYGPGVPISPQNIPKISSEEARLILASAENREAEQAERAAFAARLDYDAELANATGTLLTYIRNSASGVQYNSELARFRKELQPLARSYGFKLVLIGDKTKAALVAI